MVTEKLQDILSAWAPEARGPLWREDLSAECRRECSTGHMLCGCAAGKAQCWKEAELQCDTHFVFSVFQESSESDYSIIA